ncbi:hypothetical protein [Limosilactobacillus antri]|uniref:hypothetical protein n=1 Tax=Limosilactobacillus antri TaxID=227943 RepID=UPI001F5759DD|nr:hypothetical protein [Limosilactobacillus antri]
MHIYEVIFKALGETHIVVAKSQRQAVEVFADYVNREAGFDKFFEKDFLVNGPLDPENYYEPTVIN